MFAITSPLQAYAAAILFSSTLFIHAEAKQGHILRHSHHHEKRQQVQLQADVEQDPLASIFNETLGEAFNKRDGTCAFPYADGMVAVTPQFQNAGWAMSPDQPCTYGKYCPYACKPGFVMAQWDPSATTYSYPSSMNGGLFCNPGGQLTKPFPDQAYCIPGTGSISAKNNMGSIVSFCQTVLPGNEAMLIPTVVNSGTSVVVAVPDPSYYASSAAHYYINPAGVGVEGCIWGDVSKDVGNWAPYVAGANTVASGETFVKVGRNPIALETAQWTNAQPNIAVAIECPNGGCNGLPCRCDITDGQNVCTGGTSGAGGAQFCVVTVAKGFTANIVVYDPSKGINAGPAKGNAIKALVADPATQSTAAPSLPPAPTTTSTPPPPPPTTSSTIASTSSAAPTSSSVRATASIDALFVKPSSVAASSFASVRANTTIARPTVPTAFFNISGVTAQPVIAVPAQITTFLRGGAGMDNLQASASSSASTRPSASSTARSAGFSIQPSALLASVGLVLVALLRL
jgi:hypothetical protein